MVDYYYIGNYPKARETGWSDELQGVTHDSENWFFTQKQKLWKFPVTYDLNEKISGPDPSRGIQQIDMPQSLIDSDYDHFGDLDFYEGYLFIPVTGKEIKFEGAIPEIVLGTPGEIVLKKAPPPGIAVFSADNLEYMAMATLTMDSFSGAPHRLEEQKGAGWCAVNPQNGLLCTSNNHISPSEPIRMYEINMQQLKQKCVILTFDSPFYIKDADLNHMQGGVFSSDGTLLYLVNGFCKDFDPDDGGISIFDVHTGNRLAKSTNGHGPFNYEFHPGLPTYEEPEGITIWDLKDGRAPGVRGQLHVIMLDNDPTDDFYFKHYASYPYVANKNPHCKEVHKVDCQWVNKMRPDNKVPYTSLSDALDDGYDGCFYCLKEYHSR